MEQYHYVVKSDDSKLKLHDHYNVMNTIFDAQTSFEATLKDNELNKAEVVREVFEHLHKYLNENLDYIEIHLVRDDVSELKSQVSLLQSKVNVLKHKNKKKKKKIEEMKETIRSLTIV